jgi:hypothetical protein
VPVFLDEDNKILFVHVPKTGGTSVERLFAKSGFRTSYRDPKVGRDSVNWLRRCSPQHLHAHVLEQLFDLSRFDLVFMIVRDPVARFRSEYSMRHKTDLRTDSFLVEQWTDEVLAKYEKNPYLYDNHLRPQSEFHLPGAVVYRLEDGLQSVVDDLRGRFGLDLDDTIPHAMNREKDSGIPSHQVQISLRTEERLRDFYREDFERFGY